MDRRQKKTREAIFDAFSELLSKKQYSKITVGEIIECADVGRATFYAHFETKDFLLKELCAELFCHIFDAEKSEQCGHKHIFDCDAPSSVLLHLLEHLKKNDRNILDLLVSENNELFLRYFKDGLRQLVKERIAQKLCENPVMAPECFVVNHIASSFVETVRWWIDNGMRQSPEELLGYFSSVNDGVVI